MIDLREHRLIYVDQGSAHSISESNINSLPSSTQMSGVNYDCYINYIQQLNTSIA